MKYLKKYNELNELNELNESFLATAGAIVFGGLFLRGLIKHLKKYIKNEDIADEIISILDYIDKKIENIDETDIKIEKIYNKYILKVNNIDMEISDEKIKLNNLIIMPYDNYLTTSDAHLDLNDEIADKMKEFITNIMNKLNQLHLNIEKMRILKTYKQLYEKTDFNHSDMRNIVKTYIDILIIDKEYKNKYEISFSDVPDYFKDEISEDLNNFIRVCNAHDLLDGLDINEIIEAFYIERNEIHHGAFENVTSDKDKLKKFRIICDVFGENEIYINQENGEEENDDDTLEYIYEYYYSNYAAVKLSDYGYLDENKDRFKKYLKSYLMLFTKVLIGDQVKMIEYLTETFEFDWSETTTSGKSFIDNLDNEIIKRLEKIYPDRIRQYLKSKKTNDFNL